MPHYFKWKLDVTYYTFKIDISLCFVKIPTFSVKFSYIFLTTMNRTPSHLICHFAYCGFQVIFINIHFATTNQNNLKVKVPFISRIINELTIVASTACVITHRLKFTIPTYGLYTKISIGKYP